MLTGNRQKDLAELRRLFHHEIRRRRIERASADAELVQRRTRAARQYLTLVIQLKVTP